MPSSLSPILKVFRFVCWLGVAIWMSTVFYLSSQSMADLAGFAWATELWDKFLHFIAFFAGALPTVPALRLSTDWQWRKIYWIAFAIVAGYGAADEVHQLWTPSRSGLSFGDWLADALGALAGAGIAVFIHAKLEGRTTTRTAPAGN